MAAELQQSLKDALRALACLAVMTVGLLMMPGCSVISVSSEPVLAEALKPITDRDESLSLKGQWKRVESESFAQQFLSNTSQKPNCWVFHPETGDDKTAETDTPELTTPQLETIAESDSDSSWNAVVLLAQRDPRAAIPFRGELKKIVAGESLTISSPPEKVEDVPNTPEQKSWFTRTVEYWSGSSSQGEKTTEEPTVEKSTTTITSSPELRAAAAEVWCRVMAVEADDLYEALAEPATLLSDQELATAVRAELLLGLAEYLSPERLKDFDQFLPAQPRDVPAEMRRAAVAACLRHAQRQAETKSSTDKFNPLEWPISLEQARFDPDSQVRILYGRWSIVAGHPQWEEFVRSRITDRSIEVQTAAVEDLAFERSDQAKEILQEIVHNEESQLRPIAVRALGNWGARELLKLMDQQSILIRVALGDSLADLGDDPDARRLAISLLLDHDPRVEAAASTALKTWPDEAAVPVLFRGLEAEALRTRRECLAELRRRTGFRDPFPLTAELSVRKDVAHRLALQAGWTADQLEPGTYNREEQNQERETHEDRWREEMRSLATGGVPPDVEERYLADWLKHLPTSLEVAESIATKAEPELRANVLSVVLPKLDRSYLALKQLSDRDVLIRRRAAETLHAEGLLTSHHPLLVQELSERLRQEQDAAVWRSIMRGVMEDHSEPVEKLVLVAAGHHWPDVRLLACRYAIRHRQPHYARWLLPLFQDDDNAVRLEAVIAAGHCGNPVAVHGMGDEHGLRHMMTDPAEEVRFAAIVALARFNDPAGTAELIRQAGHGRSAVARASAIRAIGEVGRPELTGELVRLAWTERDPALTSEILKSLNEQVPPAKQPAGLKEAATSADRIAIWAEWWERTATSTRLGAGTSE
ncbi:HEAT repeat domain-containing protein [Calycomorphotria hydatis]|uniref:HEAT repeat protein n=1 Tax=Calycomorphotria hydatis TaxID=2528027 RepID=A0A517T5J4_9PLAN|nr:HEAT repeat domain-containing protein [Calycomorphotria hydatis]QDT63655.1 hypothetical protein V22_08790 [Calycomorphotria hydatis]